MMCPYKCLLLKYLIYNIYSKNEANFKSVLETIIVHLTTAVLAEYESACLIILAVQR